MGAGGSEVESQKLLPLQLVLVLRCVYVKKQDILDIPPTMCYGGERVTGSLDLAG